MKIAIGVILLASVAVTAVVYPRLPAEIATHWNAAGEVDDTTPKEWGAFLIPLIMIATAALFRVLPAISPRGYEIEATRAYRAILLAILLFLFGIHLVMLAYALAYPVSMPVAMAVLIGVLLIVIGNYMTKVPRNFFIGVRTPWTLADEDVWFRTHRLAARTFIGAGLIVAAAAPFAGGRYALPVIIVATLVAALAPIVYSYAIYRKEVPR